MILPFAHCQLDNNDLVDIALQHQSPQLGWGYLRPPYSTIPRHTHQWGLN